MCVRKFARDMHLAVLAREHAASKTPPTQQNIAAQSDLDTPFSNVRAFSVSTVRLVHRLDAAVRAICNMCVRFVTHARYRPHM